MRCLVWNGVGVEWGGGSDLVMTTHRSEITIDNHELRMGFLPTK